MDIDDLLSLLRSVLKAAGGVLIAHGVIGEGNWEVVAGVVLAVAPSIWSFIVAKQHKAAIISAAATGVPVVPGPLSPTSAPAADQAIIAKMSGRIPT